MRFLTIITAIFLCFSAVKSFAYENVTEDVEAFYVDIASYMNSNDNEKVIAMVKDYFSEDYSLIMDGEPIFNKLSLIKELEEREYKQTFDIEILNTSYDEEKGEVFLEFISETVISMPGYPVETRKRKCSDYLRVLEEKKSFELYKCDCEHLSISVSQPDYEGMFE